MASIAATSGTSTFSGDRGGGRHPGLRHDGFPAEDVPPWRPHQGRFRCPGPIIADHFAFLKSITRASPKLTIPSPAMLHMRGGRNAITRDAYSDLAVLWTDAAGWTARPSLISRRLAARIFSSTT